MEIFLTLQLFVGMLVLIAGSGLLITSLTHLAREFKIKEYLVVFIIIGFAASLPELMIALSATFQGVPELALGNALGTSIVSLTLIAGLVAFMKKKFSTKNFFKTHDITYLSLAITLLVLLTFDGRLSTFDGFVLIGAFIFYLWSLFEYKDHFKIEITETKKHYLIHASVIALALLGLSFAASYTVSAAIVFEQNTNIPIMLIGLVLIAPLGAIPELIVEAKQIQTKSSSLTFGDLFTSVVVNTTLVMGLVSIIHPFTIYPSDLSKFAGFFLIIILIVFNLFARSKDNLNWKEGLILVFAYLMFIITTFVLQLGN